MKEAVRRKALDLGFDDCRFTTAHPPQSSGHFENWIRSGQHGEMGYLSRNAHKRLDPQQVLPGAKSIVCVALSYSDARSQKAEVSLSSEVAQRRRMEMQKSGSPSPISHLPSPISDLPSPALAGQPNLQAASCNLHSVGTVARYAQHADYHNIMGERLRKLAQFMDLQGGGRTRSLWYVDTGPILEREFAQRAGLGFVGKHTNVISRRFGNWILLGEILTTLDLEPDAPEKNRCGTCTRCISACPTTAITGPFQLDARLCISYLTIELKGSIPEELRPAIGGRIFGCDDCLAACPWNRFARESQMMKQHQRDDLQRPDLLELLALDHAAFKQRFRGTPIERSKRRGLLRNVCVALGNTGDRTALPVLEKATRDPEPLIAEHAKWAIGRIDGR